MFKLTCFLLIIFCSFSQTTNKAGKSLKGKNKRTLRAIKSNLEENKLWSNNLNIDFISFNFTHSKRQDTLSIKIEKNKANYTLILNKDSTKNTFEISSESFRKLKRHVIQLSKIEFSDAKLSGKDGTICKIEYGTFFSKMSYSFWSPSIETSKRGLKDFYQLCIEMVKLAKLNPEEVL